jgi:hypothetical protein
MKTARTRLAVLAAVALGGLAVFVPTAPATPADPPAPPAKPSPLPPEPDDNQSVYAGTAIGVVLAANNNEVPRSGAQMMRVLNKVGGFVTLPVNFSAVALQSGLASPRVVIAARPSMTGVVQPTDCPGGRMPAPGGPFVTPVSKAAVTSPNLEGRLFIAANMEVESGEPRVKTFEFISWNSRQKRFDFGFIECDAVEPQIRVVDGVKCFACHKNKGPILGQGPWSNTPHNDVMRQAAARALGVDVQRLCLPDTVGQPNSLLTGLEPGIVRDVPGTEFDGLALLIPQGPAVDAAVRLGADAVRDRELFRLMTANADSRRGLVHLLCAIVAPGPIEMANNAVKLHLNNDFGPSYPNFAFKAQALFKTSSSTLLDFNPAESTGRLVNVVTAGPSIGGWGGGPVLQSNLRVVWGGDPKKVTEHNTARLKDGVPLPSKHQPSNPKAFAPPTGLTFGQPSSVVSAQQLARVIGVTEGDRVYLANLLDAAAKRANSAKVTPAALAREVFTGPEFIAVVVATQLPDREDFKDRFVTGLNAVLKGKGVEPLDVKRADYASGPNVALVPGKEDQEVPAVATTACVRCHDVPKPGQKAPFSPIPYLAFDPYDKPSREAWARETDAPKRAQVLTRLVKRVNADGDMPPEDSAESDFRAKNPAEFDAMRAWLTAELKRAKGE